jgi:hypothetical protein
MFKVFEIVPRKAAAGNPNCVAYCPNSAKISVESGNISA